MFDRWKLVNRMEGAQPIGPFRKPDRYEAFGQRHFMVAEQPQADHYDNQG